MKSANFGYSRCFLAQLPCMGSLGGSVGEISPSGNKYSLDRVFVGKWRISPTLEWDESALWKGDLMMPNVLAVLFAIAIAAPAAAADPSAQEPIEITVELGNPGGDLIFSPGRISFETGKLYKLVLNNRSPHKHYFSALRFADAIWTRKVETKGAEIKGVVREIELKPGGSAEWYIVPVKAGNFSLTCTVPGHAESGMTGILAIR